MSISQNKETIAALYAKFIAHPQICTDTRKIITGSLFFALKGDNFNANQFASKALNGGAAFAIIDEPEFATDPRCILVDDVLTALQQLANFHRRKLKTIVLAITGSNGKTTSKELLASVLSRKFKTAATIGNLNNHIGVPLTLLAVTHDTEFAVVEMGANHQQEIKLLCEIAEPQYGLITNVGKAHLEGFGGFEGVKKGKGEMYDFIKSNGGTAFVNSGSPDLMEMSSTLKKRILYGNHPDAYCHGILYESVPQIRMGWDCPVNGNKGEINAALGGAYNFDNILAAVTIGNFFGMDADELKNGIESYVPSNMRSQMIIKGSNSVLLDAYNANPSSMSAALENFSKIKSENKILILGDMMELGEESDLEHQKILSLCLQYEFKNVLLVGENFLHSKGNYPFQFIPNTADASVWLKLHAPSETAILIKGSRKMALEKLLDVL